MDIYAGDDASIGFDFLVNGDFVVPASATYKVRGPTGTVLIDTQNITVNGQTTAVVVVPGASNTIASGNVFENRYVDVSFLSSGTTYNIRRSYRVIPWTAVTAQPKDVRLMMGVSDDEFNDEEIDLFTAYLEVQALVTSDILATALAAGDITNAYANQAIVACAALDLMPTLRLRILQSQGDDTATAERYDDFDPDALQQDLMDKYEEAILGFGGPNQVADPPTYLVMSLGTDPVTGT